MANKYAVTRFEGDTSRKLTDQDHTRWVNILSSSWSRYIGHWQWHWSMGNSPSSLPWKHINDSCSSCEQRAPATITNRRPPAAWEQGVSEIHQVRGIGWGIMAPGYVGPARTLPPCTIFSIFLNITAVIKLYNRSWWVSLPTPSRLSHPLHPFHTFRWSWLSTTTFIALPVSNLPVLSLIFF
jgi:hypothetical protein